MFAGSNAQEDRELRSLRGTKRRALMRRARREINATPEGKRGRRVGTLCTAAGGAAGFGYLAAGPGFDVVPQVVLLVMIGTTLGGVIGGVALRYITSPHIRRRFRELAREELQRTEPG